MRTVAIGAFLPAIARVREPPIQFSETGQINCAWYPRGVERPFAEPLGRLGAHEHRHEASGRPGRRPATAQRLGPQAGRVGAGLLTLTLLLLLLFAAVAAGWGCWRWSRPRSAGAAASPRRPRPQHPRRWPPREAGRRRRTPSIVEPHGLGSPDRGPGGRRHAHHPGLGHRLRRLDGDFASCPASSRVEQRLSTLDAVASRPYLPLCRCSRDWESVAIVPASTPDARRHPTPST